MSPFTPNYRFVNSRRAHRGQTLIVALAILFLLLFIGGLFVTRIGRNLVSAGRSRDTSDAQALAQAGLDYCNTQLNETPEGADWRPVPTAPVSNTDPDYYYLERGFARLPLKGGRALVRVAYDPHPTNPLGQAVRIEAVGVPGELPANGADPTIFAANSRTSRLRKELIAYKQFGLIDNGLFITNKDRRSDSNFIGTSAIGNAVATVLGNPMLGLPQYQNGLGLNGEVEYGFPIRSNAGITFGSDVYLYESPRGQDPTIQIEKVLVAGNIDLLSQHRNAVYSTVNDALYPAYLNQQIDQAPNPANVIRGTTDAAGFTTLNGVVRDASLTPDASGHIRSVPYLTPPSIDTPANGSGILRYRALTHDSGYYYQGANGQALNTGQFGYGGGIYINNPTDLQLETKTAGLSGSYSQRADWLNPNAGFAQGYWNGPFYRPPGVLIELLGDRIRITRSDGQSFLNADGTPNPDGNNTTLIIPLSDAERTGTTLFTRADGTVVTLPALPHDGDNASANSPFGDKNSYGVNLVLYAEGNIRVRGVYGAITNAGDTSAPHLGRVHLTLVTNGTAYIEGSLVRGDGYLPSGATQPIMERGSTCALLAKDYVCLNTTMLMQPMTQTNVWNRQNQDLNAFSSELGQSQQRYDTGFMWGVDPSLYKTGSSSSTVYLMMRHGVLSPGPAAINLLVNPGLVNPAAGPGQKGYYRNSLYLFNEYGFTAQYSDPGGNNGFLSTPETYLLGEKFPFNSSVALQDAAAIAPNFEQKAFPLNALLHGKPIDYDTTTSSSGSLPFILQPGYLNTFRFQIDQTAGALFAGVNGTTLDSAGLQSYLLGGLMVAPLDVRIEAALYAQERSFFVIPGYALNPDPNDTRQDYIARNNVRVSYSGDAANPGVDTAEDRQLKDVFPFYNEPTDVRITVFGSVAENYAASQSDQQAWMSRWGFIPQYFGSTQYNATPIPVPDDHLAVHDPYDPTHEYSNLVPGLDTTLDYRTPIESLPTTLPAGVNPITPDVNPYRITRGLRMMYDPAFAMPYFHPTDNALSPDTDAAYMLRKSRALRSISRTVQVPNGATYTIVQVLPPIPRLPLCPNYVYAGESDRLIGSNRYDTDSLTLN